MASLVLHDIRKAHGTRPTLRGIDLAAPEGAVLALLGPSGCGKTTLLRLIAGFDRLDAGTIAFGATTVAGPGIHIPPERRHVGYVPQEGALFPHLTVLGNAGYGLPRRERRGPRLQEILAITGLTGLAGRFPHQLSGGQQQRAALARALAPAPALVLLDEPFNALDLDLRRTVSQDVIAMLRRTGTTAVLVTHDPVEAFACADIVAVMQEGRIMQAGAPDAVYGSPVNTTVARLTGAAIFCPGTVCGGRVRTAFGALSLHPACRCPPGAARVMLRPEQIVAEPEGRGTPARIIRRSFRGSQTVLTTLVDGQELSLAMPSLSAPDNGAEVFLSVCGRCVAFPVQLPFVMTSECRNNTSCSIHQRELTKEA
jgi:iron(III) transport system ATP-binding protein